MSFGLPPMSSSEEGSFHSDHSPDNVSQGVDEEESSSLFDTEYEPASRLREIAESPEASPRAGMVSLIEKQSSARGKNDETSKHGKDNWIFDLQMTLDGCVEENLLKAGSICRVPNQIREAHKDKIDCYRPQFVAMGPFHRGTTIDLQTMELTKWRYMHNLLSRLRPNLLCSYSGAIKKSEGIIRPCYGDKVEMASEQFCTMMLLDACFLFELLLWLRDNLTGPPQKFIPDYIDDHKKMSRLLTDLTLLENQIPFFLLKLLSRILYKEVGPPRSEQVYKNMHLRSFCDKEAYFEERRRAADLRALRPLRALLSELVNHEDRKLCPQKLARSLFQCDDDADLSKGVYHFLHLIHSCAPDPYQHQDFRGQAPLQLRRCARKLQALGIKITCRPGNNETVAGNVVGNVAVNVESVAENMAGNVAVNVESVAENMAGNVAVNVESVAENMAGNVAKMWNMLQEMWNLLQEMWQEMWNLLQEPVAGNVEPVVGNVAVNVEPIAGNVAPVVAGNVESVVGNVAVNVEPVAGNVAVNVEPVAGNVAPIVAGNVAPVVVGNVEPVVGNVAVNVEPVAGNVAHIVARNVKPVVGNVEPDAGIVVSSALSEFVDKFDFKIEFNEAKRELNIPTLHIKEETEIRWRNFIAWEQMGRFIGVGYKFTSYAYFFKGLVCSVHDIQLLRKKGVIRVHTEAKNEDLLIMFQSIVTGAKDMDARYRKECEGLKKAKVNGVGGCCVLIFRMLWHYLRCFLEWLHRGFISLLLSFMHTYLGTPWKFIGVVSGAALLGLTITQTIYAIHAVK